MLLCYTDVMGYYDTLLKALPFNAFALNTAGTAYVDIAGRGSTMTGTPTFTSAIIAGTNKAAAITGQTTLDITTSVFKKGSEQQPFTLLAWFAPGTWPSGSFSILSHTGAYDGLWFDGDFINFSIKSALSNTTKISWPIPDRPERYMVVGVYTNKKMQLIINGEVVSETDVPDEILTSGFLQETSSNLYTGQATSTAYKATVDGWATFGYALTNSQINDVYVEGMIAIPTFDAVGANSGSYWTGSDRNIDLFRSWEGTDWDSGVMTNTTDNTGNLVPMVDSATGLTFASAVWQGPLEIGATENATIGGVRLEWDGDGSFVVEASVNGGSTWSTITNGRLVPGTFGMDATNKVMDIRITFTGGMASDPSVVRSLKATVFSDALVIGSDTSRTLTLTDNAASALEYNEPLEKNVNSGIDVYGGTATLSQDTSSSPTNIGTLEFWIKPRSSTLAGAGGYVFDQRPGGGTAYMWLPVATGFWQFTGTSAVYLNGSPITSGSVTARFNEHVHVVAVLSATNNFSTVIGQAQLDANIEMIATYPTQLTAQQVADLYNSYNKVPSARIDDTAALVTIADHSTPFVTGNYTWESVNV